MNITYKFTLKSRKNKDGTQAILLRVIYNRKTFYFFTGLRIEPKYFTGQKVKNTYEFSDAYNLKLNAYRDKIESILKKAIVENRKVLEFEIKDAFKEEINTNINCFYDYVIQNINTEGKVHLKKSTERLHRIRVKQMQAYQKELTFSQITREWLIKFENHLKYKRNNNLNTINSKIKFIKTYINKAIRDGIVKDYVFLSYKSKSQPSKPKYLTPEEFQMLENYYHSSTINPVHKKHLHYFIFACLTGLRYTDLKNLQWKNVDNSWIIIKAEKTQAINSIPLNKKIRKYLPEQGKANDFIFTIPCNQVANRFLKDIAKAAGVNSFISCHVARHTFATLSLQMDMPLPVVSKLLGHSSIKTTEIYAKIIDKKLEEEMKKWDL